MKLADGPTLIPKWPSVTDGHFGINVGQSVDLLEILQLLLLLLLHPFNGFFPGQPG